MTTVLKLGGSVITHKDEPETVDREALDRAAGAVGSTVGEVGPLVVVHGGGSFGHHHADRHGVSTGTGSDDAEALATIHGAMTDLSDRVIGALHARGVEALPVRPLSLAHRDDGLHLPCEGIEAMLGEGFVPVLHGDVVAHTGSGGTVLGGDEIVVSLARTLGAARVGLCSTVPGVLDGGDVLDRIGSLEDAAAALGGSEATDVTGGMAGKVRALLELSTPAHVFGLDDLPEFLAGDTPGTTVLGGDR
jgi:isopentenyl phosphate kinase